MKVKWLILGLVALILVAFKGYINPADAQVEQISGLYVFIKSKPLNKFEYLGTVKGPTFSNAEFDTMLPKMLKKVKEEYPKANAVLFNGEMGSSEKYTADAILIAE